jgi:probable HAF family extracellular repeat protein
MRQLTPIIVATAMCAAASVAAAAPLYRVTVLNSSEAQGNSVNNLGITSGSYTRTDGSRHAAVWAFGGQIDLGTLGSTPGLSSRVQWPVKNVVGLISGISLTDELDPNQEGWSCGFFLNNPNFNACRGFVWDPFTAKMRELPTLGGTNGFATGTNNLAQTVGWAENSVHDSTCVFPQVLQFKPVVWGPGRDQIQPLPLVPGDTSGAATAVNDHGQIVGISGTCGFAVGGPTAAHAVLWDHGKLIQLVSPYGNLAPYWNTPMMISERGDVVGFAGFPNDPGGNFTPPFLWTREGGFQILPMLSGEIAGAATSVNAKRQVVGYSNDANGNAHPWIWVNGVTTNLNSLIAPGSAITAPMQLAFDINDRGQITGNTFMQQGSTVTQQAILLTPMEDSGDDD